MELTQDRIDRAQGCWLGQLAGDSLGSLVEFQSELSILREYPNGVRDLANGGTFNTLAGQPTDDSEMALCLARSLVDQGKFSAKDVLSRYRDWMASEPFDFGHTVSSGLRGGRDPDSQANGALMRISPLGIFGAGQNLADVARWAQEDAAITHIHPVCCQINALFAMALALAIREQTTPQALFDQIEAWAQERKVDVSVLETIRQSREHPPQQYTKHQGWVLIAFGNALWQLLHAADLEQGVIDSVRRGGDTDTNGAIAGALLGAVHGRKAIPVRWEEKILNCRPTEGVPGVENPRPECFWPVDALELSQALLASGKAESGLISRLARWMTSGNSQPSIPTLDTRSGWEIKVLTCWDNEDLAGTNQALLNIPRDVAQQRGESALEVIQRGAYLDPSGRMVEIREQISASKRRTLSIAPKAQLPKSQGHRFQQMQVQVANETTLDAGRRLEGISGTRPLLLNFANGIHPGGGFLHGARAQEECLCRNSALFATIEHDGMYKAHIDLPGGESSDWAILSRDVPVFRNESGSFLPKPWLADFLTCAAPVADWMSPGDAASLLDQRIHRVLEIASSHGYASLVLGAWGCGAFGNDPTLTARSFRRHLEGDFAGHFSNVLFAIVDCSSERGTLGPFRDAFPML